MSHQDRARRIARRLHDDIHVHRRVVPHQDVVELLLTLELLLEEIDRLRCHGTGHRIATGLLFVVGPEGESEMSSAVMRVDQNGCTATLAFKDAKGNAATPAAPPVWSTDTSGVVNLTVAADGMSAQIAPAGVGTTNINVVAEGDATPGVDTLHLTGSVQVTPAEIATGEIDFGAVS